MTRLPRFGTLVVCGAVLGACSQLIGLSDFDKTEAAAGGPGSGGNGGAAGKSMAGSTSLGGSALGGSGGSGGSVGGGAGVGESGRPATGKGGSKGNEGGMGAAAGDDAGGAPPVGKGGGPSLGGTGGSSTAGAGGADSFDCVSTLEITTGVLLQRDTSDTIYPANNTFTVKPVNSAEHLGNAADDDLWLDFYASDRYDGDRTGVFDLSQDPDNNYATCARCVWLGQDVGAVSDPRAYFFVKSGTMTIDPASRQMDGFPILRLDDVTLIESTVDVADTNVSAPVPNPRCLHLAHAAIDMPPPPSTWTCDETYYGSSDGCDCGCGAADPDCMSQFSGACDACGESGSCSTDSSYCVGIAPDDNAHCTSSPAWLCAPLAYGDGQSCDCGCGVVDVDCVSPDEMACDSCADPQSCAAGGSCETTIDPSDNSKCQ